MKRTLNRTLACATLLVVLTALRLLAQPVSIVVTLREPVPLSLATWRTDPSVVQVQLISPVDRNDVVLGIEIENTTTGQRAQTNNSDSRMPRFNLRAGVPLNLNGPQIIDQRTFSADPELQRSVVAAGAIPEGSYRFCVRVLASDRVTELSSTGAGCRNFTVLWSDPPVLNSPLMRSESDPPEVNCTFANNFNWQGITPVPAGASILYRLKIVGVLEGQEPRTALEAGTPSEVVLDEVVFTTTYTLPPNHARLLELASRRSPLITRFAWQVQALDGSRNPYPTRGGTMGKSDIGIFRASCQGSGGATTASCTNPMTLRAFFPASGDTLPWLPPHLIVQWGPYCDDVHRMDYTLTVRETGGASLPANSRTLRWSDNPITNQGLTGQPRAQERAQLIITNWRSNSGDNPPLNTQLRRGPGYEWTVDATFDRTESGRSREYRLSTTRATFALGLKLPVRPFPEDGATVDDPSDLRLRWTIPTPQTLMFDPPDVGTRRGSSDRMEFGGAAEFVRVKVSRSNDISSPVASYSMFLPATGNYGTGDAAASALFGEKNTERLNLTAGTYYWRVEYCDPADTTRSYRQGPVWQFTIGGGTSIDPTRECIRISAAAPPNGETISGSPNVLFSISTNPQINLSAVRGGRFRIWAMSSATENPATVKARAPVLDASFSGNGESNIRTASGLGTSTTRSYLNLPFINGSGSVNTFRATPNTTYLWTFTMQMDGAGIRRDGQRCTVSEVTSSDAIFTFRGEGCVDRCIKPAPTNTTPTSRAFAVGDNITIGHFSARLTRVTGTGASLSGEAVVNIPVFRGGLEVEFNNLRVNSENEVFDGEMRGKTAPSSPVNSTIANALTGGLGLTRSQVDAIHGLASDATRLVSGLSGAAPMNLPLGFDRVIEGQRVVIGVMGMVFKPTDARLNAVLSFPMPALGPGERIGFGARNVCFYPDGFGRDVDIGLVDDLGYTPSDTSWSFHFLAPHDADSGTFARFGCNGFEFIRIKAEVNFPRTWMQHSPDDGRHVKAQFMTLIRSSGEFIAEATMEQFSPTGTPDFVMQVDTIALDFSDHDNPRSIRFPEGYRGSRDNTWRGFYMNTLRMRLPEQLRTFEEGRPPTVEVANTLIDRTGFSMRARIVNVIQYPRGNFGEWGASLDTAGIDFVSSSLERGYLIGRIKIPISDSALDYNATLSRARDTAGAERGLQFEFTIRPRDTINAPLWVARMQLNPTCYIRLRANASGFLAEAMLSGAINLTGDANGIPLGFRGIRFENFHLTTQAPYIECGSWSFASPQHGLFIEPDPPPSGGSGNNGAMSGFPVSISGIQVVGGTRERGRPGLGIRFTISVNLQPGNNAISGGTTLSVWGALETGGGPMRAVFDGVDLDSIGLRADMGAVSVEGSVAFYRRDPTFGTGFRGAIRANFLRMVEVAASIQYGAKPISPSSSEEFRYWYVDARATFSSGIMVFSGVGIYGFGGGAWYNMVRETPSTPSGGALSGGDRSLLTPASGGGGTSPTPGATNSGSRYVPSYDPRGATFGFYGMITVGTYPSADAFNCDVRLEVSFAGGGIREIRLRGDGFMMAGINNRSNARVTMFADISYNFPDRIFNGIFDVRINAAVVRGGGRMVMYFSPTTWHVKIGDPEVERVSITLADIIQVQAYMMCGMNLPNTMGLPREILECFRSVPPPPRGMSQLQRGDGFAFGAMASVPPGPNPFEARFLIFYASLKLIIGFDVSILNYGPNATCANTGSAMGINGWYAMGQIYARVDASVGLFVDLWFVQGRFEILGLRAAAYLRAGLPNPTWMQGGIAGDYRILGGLVQGHCEFQFSVGEECRPIVENGAAGIDWYSQISPADGSTDVSIFIQPAVAANLPLERPFYLEEPDGRGGNVIRVYRLKVRNFTMTRPDRGETIPSSNQVNAQDAHYVVQTPGVQLTQRTRYTTTLTAYAQQFTPNIDFITRGVAAFATMNDDQRLEFLRTNYNGTSGWTDATYRTGDRRGQVIEKSISSTFTTETLPDTIRPQEVNLSYPRNRQRWFLQGECPDGFISLLNNRADLFPTGTGVTRYEYVLRFISLPGNQRQEIPFSYRASSPPYYIGERRDLSTSALRNFWNSRGGYISFEIPPLANNTMYAAQVIRRRVSVATSAISGSTTSFLGSAVLGMGGGGSTAGGGLSTTLGGALSGSAVRTALAGVSVSQLYPSMLARYGSTLNIQQRTVSGFELGRAVEDNEKLLYLMFFKTSRFNRLQQKVASLTRSSVTATPAVWNLQTLKASYTGPELFDPFDVEYQTVELGVGGSTQLYQIAPLILSRGAARTSQWHNLYANPLIYDGYHWMQNSFSRYYPITRELNYDRMFRTGETFLDAPSVDPALYDGEISSVANPGMMRTLSMLQRVRITIQPSQSGSSLGLGGVSGGTVGFAPYAWNVTYLQPAILGFLDYPIARNTASALISMFCGGGDVGFTAAECARLRQIATTSFRYPEAIRPSRYRIDMLYNYCPRDPDTPTPSYDLYFEY